MIITQKKNANQIVGNNITIKGLLASHIFPHCSTNISLSRKSVPEPSRFPYVIFEKNQKTFQFHGRELNGCCLLPSNMILKEILPQ